jgi:hypothetical protein
MKTIIIEGLGVNETLDIVRELRAQGLVQGTDFDFRYEKPAWHPESYEQIAERQAEFKFYDDKYATLFALRYASK